MSAPARAVLAWLVLMCTGLVAALTGQLDCVWFGHPVAGERFPFVAGLAISAMAIGHLGRRTYPERQWRDATLIMAGLALVAAPISFEHMSIGWLAHQVPVWGAHVGLCLQLLAWAAAARKARGSEELGVWIMAAGMIIEAMVILPLAQLVDVDAACTGGMRLTCTMGSATVALPALVTLALVTLWLGPVRDRIRRL